ncbi:hypothetical protein L596_029658 [Steinernema carpocapsae]|uniref:MATH domain-containing protein n=1 Tax=Steinernema carpocapsae TaxID=34508 RepID=A0A4U5LVA9_STECR|nr:hypothetical protein L596_029658 [Steinernema carpocapsae]
MAADPDSSDDWQPDSRVNPWLETRRSNSFSRRRYRRPAGADNPNPRPPARERPKTSMAFPCRPEDLRLGHSFQLSRNWNDGNIFAECVAPEVSFCDYKWKLRFTCSDYATEDGVIEPWVNVFVECNPDEGQNVNFMAKIEVWLISWIDEKYDMKRSVRHFGNWKQRAVGGPVITFEDFDNRNLGFTERGHSIFRLMVTYL